MSDDQPATATFALAFQNDAASLARARDAVRKHLHAVDVDETAIYAVDLALEEIAGNTLRYGYEVGAKGSIRIALSVTATALELWIADDARPFDPTRHPEPTPSQSLRDAPLGGRGISMVRRAVRAMRYRRQAGENRLELDIPRAPTSS